MRGDEAAVLAGLAMGVAALEMELLLAPEVLDTATDELDLSLFLRDGNYLRPATEEDPDVASSRYSEESFLAMADESATLRALNARLQERERESEARARAAEERAQQAQTREAQAAALVQAAEDKAAAAAAEQAAAEQRVRDTVTQCEARIAASQADLSTERDTYQTSRAGLNDMFDALSKQLATEKAAREEMERDVERAHAARVEAETATEAAKAVGAEREAAVEALRKQLREVKNLNLKMLGSMQVREGLGVRG